MVSAFFVVDGTYYLFYTGYDASGEGVSVGLATSSDSKQWLHSARQQPATDC
jgi:predicted GH43/DUF377 family glycosyl hydrolase